MRAGNAGAARGLPRSVQRSGTGEEEGLVGGVKFKMREVRDDLAAYAGADRLCYSARDPDALLAAQASWDPVFDWARDELGARFILSEAAVMSRSPSRCSARSAPRSKRSMIPSRSPPYMG